MCVACIGVRRCEFQMAPDIVLWKPSMRSTHSAERRRHLLVPPTAIYRRAMKMTN